MKEVNKLYVMNFKSLKKEFGEDTRRWKELPCSSIRVTINSPSNGVYGA